MDLTAIEKLTERYADERALLDSLVMELQGTLENVKNARLPKIRKAVAATAASLAHLREALADAPELFDKPKTQIFHGIRVGYRKGKGEVEWNDEALVVARIKEHFGNVGSKAYLVVTERPSKDALKELEPADLRKLGARIEGDGEEVYVKETDGEAEKVVNALLKGAIKEATA